MLAVLVTSLVGLLALATAPSYTWLVIAMVIAGLANSAANPSTNHVITTSLPPRRFGLAAGFKMACVQAAIVSAGFAIPPLARTVGWRIPVAVGAVVGVVTGIVLLLKFLGVSAPKRTPASIGRRVPLQQDLVLLTLYALLMSAGASATLTYLSLYSVEGLGSTAQVGGAAVAIAGTMGILGRVALGRLTGGRDSPMGILAVVGLVAVAATLCLMAADVVASPAFWLGVLGLGISANSFVAGATVALIETVSREQIGGASGIMFLGTLIGFGSGPAVFGLAVETAGYRLAWILTAASFAAGAVVALVAGRIRRR